MSALPLDLYDSAIDSHSGPDGCRCHDWRLRYADGRALPLDLARWCDEPDAADRALLDRCTNPTLDVGCGPGRLVSALTAAGGRALGVDVANSAVRLTRLAGGEAIRRSVFSSLPDEGRWVTVLLADGNIGIGGNPVALLERCRQLLAPAGQILVEVDPPGSASTSSQVRLEARHQHSSWFSWAHLAADRVESAAASSDLLLDEVWTVDDRWFACLTR